MVLSEYMKEHPDYYANMIAAYCIGDSLTGEYLEKNPHVKAAQTADDLGVGGEHVVVLQLGHAVGPLVLGSLVEHPVCK